MIVMRLIFSSLNINLASKPKHVGEYNFSPIIIFFALSKKGILVKISVSTDTFEEGRVTINR